MGSQDTASGLLGWGTSSLGTVEPKGSAMMTARLLAVTGLAQAGRLI